MVFRMTTTLLVLGVIWVSLSLVFCLALCVAAAKPLPRPEEETIERKPARPVDADALCAR